MGARVGDLKHGLTRQLILQSKMPLLHHRRLEMRVDRVEQRVVGIAQRTCRKALRPKVIDHQAGVRRRTRLQPNRAVAGIQRIGIGWSWRTTWRIERLLFKEWRIEAGRGERKRAVLLRAIENSVAA